MKAKGKRILVVEDDLPIQRNLQRNLEVSGFEVLITNEGKRAIELVRSEQPDLVLLDLWLRGDVDGIEVCSQVRQWTQIPIIVVSARADEKQKVEALDLGADDFLAKPFNVEELLARVRVCLRRVANQELESATQHEALFTTDGRISMNLARRQVIVGGNEVKLTPTE
jgi:two-component system, OmpR family, KDP operon response regulator KdpE